MIINLNRIELKELKDKGYSKDDIIDLKQKLWLCVYNEWKYQTEKIWWYQND